MNFSFFVLILCGNFHEYCSLAYLPIATRKDLGETTNSEICAFNNSYIILKYIIYIIIYDIKSLTTKQKR